MATIGGHLRPEIGSRPTRIPFPTGSWCESPRRETIGSSSFSGGVEMDAFGCPGLQVRRRGLVPAVHGNRPSGAGLRRSRRSIPAWNAVLELTGPTARCREDRGAVAVPAVEALASASSSRPIGRPRGRAEDLHRGDPHPRPTGPGRLGDFRKQSPRPRPRVWATRAPSERRPTGKPATRSDVAGDDRPQSTRGPISVGPNLIWPARRTSSRPSGGDAPETGRARLTASEPLPAPQGRRPWTAFAAWSRSESGSRDQVVIGPARRRQPDWKFRVPVCSVPGQRRRATNGSRPERMSAGRRALPVAVYE